MGRIWLGAPHDGRSPVSGSARGSRSAVHDAGLPLARLVRQPAQQHSQRDGGPAAGNRPAPLRWLAWLTRR
jgi:hypothetical protein